MCVLRPCSPRKSRGRDTGGGRQSGSKVMVSFRITRYPLSVSFRLGVTICVDTSATLSLGDPFLPPIKDHRFIV